jgi:hypothetical protein
MIFPSSSRLTAGAIATEGALMTIAVPVVEQTGHK